MGVIGVAVGFAILYWMIRQFDKDGTLKSVFTPPKSSKAGDWVGWLIVVSFLLLVFYQMVNFILTGENGCDQSRAENNLNLCQVHGTFQGRHAVGPGRYKLNFWTPTSPATAKSVLR
jgi:hypothetical protein